MTDEIVTGEIAPSREELDRPSLLARAFEPLTRLLFTEVGLRPGMRVLDVCSGSGDVALVAREFVGPKGHVMGFDRSSATVAYANERAAFRDLSNVYFVEAEIERLPFGRDFDAIVGRTVLMYRRDPVQDLRALLACLKPRGLVVFQELDLFTGRTDPPADVVDEVRAWLLDFFSRAGLELDMGSKLYASFKAAGLNVPQLRVDGFIGGAESICPGLLASVARLLLPQAEAMGTVRAEEVEIDTLEERMRANLISTGGIMSTALLIGAWARMPD